MILLETGDEVLFGRIAVRDELPGLLFVFGFEGQSPLEAAVSGSPRDAVMPETRFLGGH